MDVHGCLPLRAWWAAILCLGAAWSSAAGAALAATRPADSLPTTTMPSSAEARALLARYDPRTPVDAAVAAQVTRLLGRLSDDDYQVRQRATEELAALGPAIWSLMRQATRHPDAEVASRAEVVLKALDAQSASDEGALRLAVEALVSREEAAVIEVLIRLVDSPFDRVRFQAEYGLLRATGRSFGDCVHASLAGREAIARDWERWWEGERRTFSFRKAAAAATPAGVLVCLPDQKTVVLYDLAGREVARRQVSLTPHLGGQGLADGRIALTDGLTLLELSPDGASETLAMPPSHALQTVQVLPNGNLLMAEYCGAKLTEYSRKGEVIWSHPDRRDTLFRAAHRQADGNTLVLTDEVLAEVDAHGNALWREEGKGQGPVTRLPNGNVFLRQWNDQYGVEMAPGGKVVWHLDWSEKRMADRGNLVGLERLPDGQTLVAAQKLGVVLVDGKGQVTRTLHGADEHLGNVSLLSAAVMQRWQAAPR